MPEHEIDPIEVVEVVLRNAKFGNDNVDKVIKFLKANRPETEAQMAADRAILQEQQEKFVERFPNSKRLGGTL
ncbi:hypothetical protein [Acidocella aminolytica]|nr:hypothetical protein [Acidocella aminolytica]SHF02202.1 hypothetical protein SAMN02746095_01877 [Acidocella aminolytica 101 = DSM 11237]